MSALAMRIRTTATELVEERGHPSLSMRALGEALGVSPMAVYRHYRDRDDLLDAVAETGFQRLEAALGRRQPGGEPRSRVRALFSAYLEFGLAHPHLFELMFLTRRERIRRFPEDFRAGRSNSFRELHLDVAACLGVDDESPQALEITLSLWAHAHGLITLHRVGRFENEATFRSLYDRAVDRALEGWLP